MPNFGIDDWMDAQLRNVPVPHDLLSRLAENSAADDPASADARLDAVLRNVPVPQNLEIRLRRIARHRAPAPWWLRAGLAASVFLALGLGTAGYLGLITGALGPGRGMLAENPNPGPASSNGPEVHDDSRFAATVSPRVRQPRSVADQKIIPAIDERAIAPDSVAQTQDTEAEGVTSLWNRLVDAGSALRRELRSRQRVQAALGAGGNFDRLPSLDVVELPPARGLAPPLVRGYDMLFQLKHGEHPFVSPAHKDLQSTRVPLTFSTASYDLAVRAARRGQLLPGDEIRVEDFLAAQNHALPPAPAGDLALRVAGSSSPFGQSGLQLLGLAVQAGSNAVIAHQPARLIVAVDTSASMRRGARGETVRRGLAKLADHLAQRDRITLIGFAEQPRVLAENATGGSLRSIVSSNEFARPAGSADFAAAIRLVCKLATEGEPGEARRVVFITAGSDELDEADLATASQSLAALADAKIPWQIVRMSAAGVDSQSTELAEQGHGEISTVNSAADVHAMLLKKLVGRSSTIAGGVTLKLTFSSRQVSGYRLLGHESSTLTGAPTGPLEIDFQADEAATALVELTLKPGGEGPVAAAELSWRDPASGRPRREVRVIKREDLTGAFSKAPPWLQQGAIAAKAAEALRGSYFAPVSHPAGQVLSVAEQVDPRVAEQPDFRGLLDLLRQAEKRR